jgi:hypothetical protein
MFSFLNTNVAEATISNRSRGIEEIAGAAAGGRGGDSKTKTKTKKTEADLRLELVQKQRCGILCLQTLLARPRPDSSTESIRSEAWHWILQGAADNYVIMLYRHHRELIVLQRDLKQRLARNADAPGMYRAIQNKADQVAAEIQVRARHSPQ